MSRPKLPEEQKKRVHVTLSFTSAEETKLRLLAAQENMDLRDYLHELAYRAMAEDDTARTVVSIPGAGEEEV